jgi:hypothetical protein
MLKILKYNKKSSLRDLKVFLIKETLFKKIKLISCN